VKGSSAIDVSLQGRSSDDWFAASGKAHFPTARSILVMQWEKSITVGQKKAGSGHDSVIGDSLPVFTHMEIDAVNVKVAPLISI
jgi:hypothetical protein